MSDQHPSLEEHVMRSARAHLFGHPDAFGVPRGRVLVAARPRRPGTPARGVVMSLSARLRLPGRRVAVPVDAGSRG